MTEIITEPAVPTIEEMPTQDETEKLTELQKWERAKIGFVCIALGFGGSASLLIADAIMYDEIRNGSILIIGGFSFLMFMFAIIADKKAKKSSREAL
ncbi:hypothetical protein MettiDRAFT_2629 [Methanolobus tindarius DSM 2278]|uniref:Uncharacterized protein n=1 Tax=Methanolobus tindarius DSM 2278 TaxID=1090322 RepID=W9DU45_METTI|nr:hypothetical protein [Methanolobus tindarius]ETA69135.1 hypothetical protein MettiDRAFT_2629 [Methanolobus tindarius DSM 2278]